MDYIESSGIVIGALVVHLALSRYKRQHLVYFIEIAARFKMFIY